MVALQIENYQKMAQQFRATKVWPRKVQERDWVLKRMVDNQKKFEPNWKRPFEVAKALGRRSYILRNIYEGKQLPRTWNVINLNRYYV